MIAESPFDSAYFDLRVGRLAVDTAAELDRALDAGRGQFDVVFVRARDGAPVVETLAARELAPLETLVTSTWRDGAMPTATSPIAIEQHATLAGADLEAIAEITAEAITNSHFHHDPRLPKERTRRLYAAWARNDATGRAYRTFVAREGGAIVGYITVLLVGRTAVIDLVAVVPAAQGRGIGSALLSDVVTWLRREGLGARVGTQSDNPALALYGRYGFVPTDRQATYHLWLA